MTHQPTPADLADLLERVEKAEGADRELDWRIAEVTGHEAFDRESAHWPPFGVGSKVEQAIPAYTASLDAALALVERKRPGWHWQTGTEPGGKLASAWLTSDDGLHTSGEVFAKTPALALIAALLRSCEVERG